MAISYNPSIVTNGLVLNLDAANIKGYDSSENLISNSEFAYIQQSGNTVATSGQSFAPYGRNTAVNFINNGGAGNTYIYQNFGTTFSSGTQYVISIFSNSPTLALDQGGLAAGKYTQISSGSVLISDGWYRHWVSYSATVSNPNITPQVTVNPGINVTLCGWQLELGSSITNYTRTTGTAKNRGTILTDLSGKGYNGTLTNGPTYSSANGGSIVLDGSNDVIVGTIDGSIFTGNFTQSAWIYKLNANQIWQGVFTNSSPATPNTYLMTFGNGSVAAPYNSVGVNQVGVSESGVFLDIGTHINKWLNIIITKFGTSLTIYCYKDGTLLKNSGTITWNSGNFNTTNNYQVGIHWTGGTVVPLQGNVSQVSVYNRVLTESEIQQNFNALRGRFGV